MYERKKTKTRLDGIHFHERMYNPVAVAVALVDVRLATIVVAFTLCSRCRGLVFITMVLVGVVVSILYINRHAHC